MYNLITGANGFVGKNLIPYLNSKGETCKVFDRGSLSNLDFKSLNDIDTIIHLAGKAHDLKKTLDPNEYYRVNYELTRKIYDAFLLSDAKKFIFVSSVKAVADNVEGELTEAVNPEPQTDYGRSKLMAEEYIKKQVLPEGKIYYILRPCMVHGPGNKGNLNLLYQFVKMGIPYPLGLFENKRSFLSVDNLCFVINELLKQDVEPGIYNVSDDEPLSTNIVVGLLAKASSKKISLWKLPIRLIKILALIGDTLRLPFNSEKLGKLTDNYIVSNEKIKKALKADLPLTAREGIVKTANSFKLS